MPSDTARTTASLVSRRTLIGGLPLAGLLALAGCSGTASTGSSSAAATAATAVPTAAPATSGSIASLAQAFQATLSSDQQATLVQEYTLANAQRWSNLPQALVGGGMGGAPGASSDSTSSDSGRLGISIGDLDDSQLAAITALLTAATGSTTGLGYDEITQHLNADDYLGENGGGSDYGRANFYLAFLGAPGDTGTWELQFGGHHLAVANTYIDGVLAGATPAFRGIEPNGTFEYNGISNQPMAAKESALTALLAGLTSDQLASAKLSKTYSDLALTPGNDWAFPTTYEGVQVSSFTDEQKQLVLAAIASYVDDIADADAATILAKYESELSGSYVAYSGSVSLTEQNDYIRIDGPSVWIEFSMQHGIVLDGNHPHSVWRDRVTDYGGTKS